MRNPAPVGRPRHGVRADALRPALALLLFAALAAGAAAGVRVEPDPRKVRGAAAEQRPFEHAVHEAVSCTACHGAGDRHRTLLVRSSRDCAACHHDPARTADLGCTKCHAVGTLPEPGTVPRELSFGVWPAAQTRELPFGHVLHADVACGECHRTPVLLAVDRPCGSCHEPHHRAEAECAACHTPLRQPVHDAGVHLSCAGAGCHAAAVAPSPVLSRSLCISCHSEQRSHEPDGVCASCHLIPTAP